MRKTQRREDKIRIDAGLLINRLGIVAVIFIFIFHSHPFTAFEGRLWAARVKDIAKVGGNYEYQLIGYGVVVGLNGTGDTPYTLFTLQSVSNMLRRFGINISETNLKIKNVAAVAVTATLPSFVKRGNTIDVWVSSLGDATSLQGGTLLLTQLQALDGKVIAVAQGPLSMGASTLSQPEKVCAKIIPPSDVFQMAG